MPNPFISQSERSIRNAVVSRARALWPDARIVHELNVEHGQVRADVAAVTPDQLILFEIKSERDKLHRLSNQLRQFGPVCHHVIVAAHEKWCGGSQLPNGDVDPIIRFAGHGHLWVYPRVHFWSKPWPPTVPWPHRMLRLLWTEELRDVASSFQIDGANRRSGHDLCRDLALTLTGQQIEHAVCATLRQRPFAEADPPIVEVAA